MLCSGYQYFRANNECDSRRNSIRCHRSLDSRRGDNCDEYATGIVNKTLTNESGAYQFASLQSGSYRFTAELAGFQTRVSETALGVSQQVRLNFTLQVGSLATEVNVTETADSVLATTSSSIGSVLSESQVSFLPMATRNVLDLIQTTAGTNTRDGFEWRLRRQPDVRSECDAKWSRRHRRPERRRRKFGDECQSRPG